MKNIYFIFFLLFFLTLPAFAGGTNSNYEVGMSLSGFYFPFPYTSCFAIHNDNIYDEVDISIFYLKDFKYYFYIFEYEMNYGFHSFYDVLFLFLKTGIGGYFEIGPLIIRASVSLSPGFYYMDGYFMSNDPDDFNLYFNEYYDFYISAEPNIAIGLKLQEGFNFYFGLKVKYFLFLKYDFPDFKPYFIYFMFSYYI
jgi:hypothetical protein